VDFCHYNAAELLPGLETISSFINMNSMFTQKEICEQTGFELLLNRATNKKKEFASSRVGDVSILTLHETSFFLLCLCIPVGKERRSSRPGTCIDHNASNFCMYVICKEAHCCSGRSRELSRRLAAYTERLPTGCFGVRKHNLEEGRLWRCRCCHAATGLLVILLFWLGASQTSKV
jgi:hypothetical protein